MAETMNGVTLDTAVLDKMIAEAKGKAGKIVNTYGLLIASDSAQNAPVDTGALKNSITAESHMEGDLLFIVQDGVDYGEFQELGTSKMAAHPFMIPAVEKHANEFLNAFAALFGFGEVFK